MNFPLFTGCATALITPFLPDGRLDEPALRRLLAMQTAAKMDALVLLGTTGEPCTLSMDERERIIEIGLECTGCSIPVIVGTGSNDTTGTITGGTGTGTTGGTTEGTSTGDSEE